jgi:hypothetical protein
MIPQIVWWCTQRARCSCTEAPQTTPSRRSLHANTRKREHGYRSSLFVSVSPKFLEYMAWREGYLGSGCERRRAGGGPRPWRTRRQLQPLRSPTSMSRPLPPLEGSPAASPAGGSRFARASLFVNLGAAAAARLFRRSMLPRPLQCLRGRAAKDALTTSCSLFPSRSLWAAWMCGLAYIGMGLFCTEFLGWRDVFSQFEEKKESTLLFSTFAKVRFFFLNSKTGQNIPLNLKNHASYPLTLL